MLRQRNTGGLLQMLYVANILLYIYSDEVVASSLLIMAERQDLRSSVNELQISGDLCLVSNVTD